MSQSSESVSRARFSSARRPKRIWRRSSRVTSDAWRMYPCCTCAQVGHHRAIVDQHADLGIQRERADVEVRRADERDLVVDAQVLGVQEAAGVAKDAHAGLQHDVVVGLLRELHQRLVRLLVDDQLDRHAAPCGAAHRRQKGLARNDVGRGQHDPRPRAVHQRDHHRLRRAFVVARSAGDDLREPGRRPRALGGRQAVGLRRQVAGLEITVAQQHRVQVAHDGAGRAHEHFLVDQPAIGMRAHDVLRPEEGEAAVDDDDLAMIAQVEARGVRSPQSQRHDG